MQAIEQKTLIEIAKMRRDGGTQPRTGLNQEHVQDLADFLDVGIEFPPILVFYDGQSYWLVDGFHRTEAHLMAKKNKINATIRAGTLQDAQWESYRVNQHFALKRTHADKQRQVVAALKHPYGINKSNNAIALHCGVSVSMVREWRSKLENEGEIQVATQTEVVKSDGTKYARIKARQSTSEQQKFKVVSPDIPEYYGQVVELESVKSGDCYQCRTSDGTIYPFLKSELGDINAQLQEKATECPSHEPIEAAIQASLRQKIVTIILRIPDEKLSECEELLLQKYGGILAKEAIGI